MVTGASRGIGAATAELLAESGFDVCVGYRRDADSARRVVAACKARRRRAIAVEVDVASEEEVTNLFARAEGELGRLKVLVNNAGIVATKARVDEVTFERLHQIMGVNVIGPFLCAREAVRRMSTAHGGTGGSIVNVSSAASRFGSRGRVRRLRGIKRSYRHDDSRPCARGRRRDIRVNAVRPGFIETDLHASGWSVRTSRTSRCDCSHAARWPTGGGGGGNRLAMFGCSLFCHRCSTGRERRSVDRGNPLSPWTLSTTGTHGTSLDWVQLIRRDPGMTGARLMESSQLSPLRVRASSVENQSQPFLSTYRSPVSPLDGWVTPASGISLSCATFRSREPRP